MDLSFIAMHRMLETRAAKDSKLRRKLKRTGRPLLSDARRLSDEALADKLRELGVTLDRDSFLERSRDFLSAEAMTEAFPNEDRGRWDADWLWFCLLLLWERWQPERPSLEMIDDRMQEGYRLCNDVGDLPAACRCWLRVWRDMLAIMDALGLETIEAFDAIFRGTQFASNWLQDFEMELGNGALDEPSLYETRIAYCSEYLERFGGHESSVDGNMRWAIADSHAQSGDREAAEQIFESWLEAEPEATWGWIYWSDMYSPIWGHDESDPDRAEQLLKRALKDADGETRSSVLERLEDLYQEVGRAEDAERIRSQLSAGKPQPTWLPPSTEPTREPELPAPPTTYVREGRKIGRNEPCPCGSGKKYKKCCGR